MSTKNSNNKPAQKSNLKLALGLIFLLSSFTLGYFAPSILGRQATSNSQVDQVEAGGVKSQTTPVITQVEVTQAAKPEVDQVKPSGIKSQTSPVTTQVEVTQAAKPEVEQVEPSGMKSQTSPVTTHFKVTPAGTKPEVKPVSTKIVVAANAEQVSKQAQTKQVRAHFEMSKAHEDMIESYCFDCHDDTIQKGNIRLDNLASLKLDERLEVFNKIQEQVYLKHMPPKKKSQPTIKERDSLFKWVSAELDKHQASQLANKLSKPHYANYVDHKKLFSGEIKEESFSPPRLWRRSPYHFSSTSKGIFGRDQDEAQDKVKQPFNKGGGEGISDYASAFFADSATFDTLHRNAVHIVDRTLLMAFTEMDFKSRGKTMDDWRSERKKVISKQKKVIAQMKKDGKNPRYVSRMHRIINKKYGLKTPQVYRDIILGRAKPTKAMIKSAINYHFNNIIKQKASDEDLSKYANFMQSGIREAGPYFGLRNTLIAILCSPKFIYRSELGLGKPVSHGRNILSPLELSYAISYALTDSKPDDKLIKAAETGKLTSRTDVKREVTRLLEDNSIAKPRILRFFHEFFGYHHAPEIFKDDKRFIKNYTNYGVAHGYVNDTNVLVKYILKQDKHVIKRLLSTEKYFVGHSGNNKKEKEEKEAYKKFFAYFKDKNWRSYVPPRKKKSKSQNKLIKPTAADLKFAQSLHPNFKGSVKDGKRVHSIMKMLYPFYKKGISPSSYSQRRPSEARFKGVLAYNITANDWDFPTEQPFVLAKGKRAGILSHPSWLIAHSLNSSTDPVRRGKWIREHLLAGTIPDVPITVDATIPENPHETLRQRYSLTEAKKCWKCHVHMNPLGYPFEVFDDFGRLRDKEKLEGMPKIKGIFETRPINSKGYLAGTNDKALDGKIENAYDLVNRLAKSRKVQQSVIRHTFRYWMGRNELLTDSKTLIRAEKAYMDNDGSFKELLISLLTSDSFIYRKRLD